MDEKSCKPPLSMDEKSYLRFFLMKYAQEMKGERLS
jgi:hypothetical protein